MTAERTKLLSLCGVALALAAMCGGGGPAAAQGMPSREFMQAELSELAPEIRAEVDRRATQGNTPRGVLETMLLNEIQVREPASAILALDFGRGVVVFRRADGNIGSAFFDKRGLKVAN